MTIANDAANADVSEDTNDNAADAGSGADNTQNNQVVAEKKYSDKDFDDFVKRKTPELESRIKSKLEKQYEGKIIYDSQEAVDKLIKEAVDAALKDEQLKAVRLKIQEEYGLDEYRVSKLEGDDEKSLREDADKTYGKPKKAAPVLNGGANNTDSQQVSPFAQQQLQRVNELKKKHHIK